MDNLNLLTVLRKLAQDVNLDSRSLAYCIRRTISEGPQFLTITLPALSKSVLHSLEVGYFCRPTEFAWKGRSLRYFRSLLSGIFDIHTGSVLPEVDAIDLWRVRQFSEYFYKLCVPFTPKQKSKAEQDYLSCERDLASFKPRPSWISQLSKFILTKFPFLSSDTIVDVLRDHRPRFTSGSFSGSNRFRQAYYLYKLLPQKVTGTTLKKYEGISGFFKPYPSAPSAVVLSRSDTSDYAEVLFVPKDSRKPRVISKEPMHQLRLQMSCFDYLSLRLERHTSNRINFRDQKFNRELAEYGSTNRKICTLDLQEASDRVSFRLVTSLFRHSPVLSYFLSTRSRRYRLPSGASNTLMKMSGMGSGLTFCIMSLIIWSSVVCAAQAEYPRSLHKMIEKSVYVYGDDLIVPTFLRGHAIKGLNRSGLKVNTKKSFSNSFFRESCGGDYFMGNDVSPVRLKLSNADCFFKRTRLCFGKRDAALLGIERHCRELVKNGHMSLANYYYNFLEQSLSMTLPRVTGETSYLGRYSVTSVDYSCDDVGNYVNIFAYAPTPVEETVQGLDPYKILAPSLSPSEVTWKTQLFPDMGSRVSRLSVPREIKLKGRSVSSYALMG